MLKILHFFENKNNDDLKEIDSFHALMLNKFGNKKIIFKIINIFQKISLNTAQLQFVAHSMMILNGGKPPF